MVKITVLPPGEAIGARDLQRWSGRRSGGRSNTGVTLDATKIAYQCHQCGRKTEMLVNKKMGKTAKFRCSRCGSFSIKFL